MIEYNKNSVFTYELTELGLAKQFADEFKDKYKYNTITGQWFMWNGKIWLPDESERKKTLIFSGISTRIIELYKIIEETGKYMKTEDSSAMTPEYKFISKMQNEISVNHIINILQSDPNITVTEMDNYPNIWTFDNGTFDINNYEFIDKFIPNNKCTKMIPYKYDPNAKCDKWMKHLEFVFVMRKTITDESGNIISEEEFIPDNATINAFQQSVGYTLAVGQPAQVIFILHGDGQNGKSVTMKVILKIFDKFARQSSFKVIAETDATTPRNELYHLKDYRFVVFEEVQESANKIKSCKLDSSLMKNIRSGNLINARPNHKDGNGITCEFKLWMTSNKLPTVSDNTYAFWRSVITIPFNRTISECEKIEDYENILLEEASGIINWIITGYKNYKQHSIGNKFYESPSMIELKEQYHIENDDVYEFAKDFLVPKIKQNGEPMKKMDAYKEYCDKIENDNRLNNAYKRTEPKPKKQFFEQLISSKMVFIRKLHGYETIDINKNVSITSKSVESVLMNSSKQNEKQIPNTKTVHVKNDDVEMELSDDTPTTTPKPKKHKFA